MPKPHIFIGIEPICFYAELYYICPINTMQKPRPKLQVSSFKPLKTSSFTRKKRKNYVLRLVNGHGCGVFPYSPLVLPFHAYLRQFEGQHGNIPYMAWIKALERAKQANRPMIIYDKVGETLSNHFPLVFFLLTLPSPISMVELSSIWGSDVKVRMCWLRQFGLVNYVNGLWRGSVYSYNRCLPTYELACKYFEEAINPLICDDIDEIF